MMNASLPSSRRLGIGRRAGWVLPVGVAAYVARFAGSWLVLERVGPERFDPHGFGLLFDGLLLLAQAPVVIGVMAWLVWRRRRWRGLLARGATAGGTAGSVLALAILGAPLPGQAYALVLLPIREGWPVLVSVVVWFAAAAVGRGLAIGEPGSAGR